MRGVPIATAEPGSYGREHVTTVQGRRRALRGRVRLVGRRRHGARPERARHAADASVRPELLVLRELPDRAEPLQRRQHPRHQLRHRVLGRHRVCGRLRRLPRLRRLDAHPAADLGRPLLRPAGRPVGVRHGQGRRGRHARPLRRQRAHEQQVRRRPRGEGRRDGPLSGGRLGGPARLRHLRPGHAGAGRGRLPGLRLAHEHAAARAAREAGHVRPQLELPAGRRPDLRPAGRRAGARRQPRRRAGHRGAVRRPVEGA